MCSEDGDATEDSRASGGSGGRRGRGSRGLAVGVVAFGVPDGDDAWVDEEAVHVAHKFLISASVGILGSVSAWRNGFSDRSLPTCIQNCAQESIQRVYQDRAHDVRNVFGLRKRT